MERPSKQDTSRMTAPLVAITVVAALLRLPTLGSQSVWLDEAAASVNAKLLIDFGPKVMAEADHLPPLSFLLQAASIQILGNTEFALRLPSALAGIAAPWLIALVVSQFLGRRSVALSAAFLMAVSPYAVWYSQEGRMYALLITLSLVSVWLWWPVIDGDLPGVRAAAVAVISAAGLWTHHYYALLTVAFAIYLLIRRRLNSRAARFWLVAQAAAAASFVPWLVLSSGHAAQGSGFEKGGQFFWAPYTVFSFVGGHSFGPTVQDLRLLNMRAALAASAGEVILGGLLVLAIALVSFGALWRTARPELAWLLLWLGVPLTLAIIAPMFTGIAFNVRYVSVAFPALVIAWAVACSEAVNASKGRHRAAGATATLLTVVVVGWSLVNWYTDPRVAKEDVRSLAAAMRQEVRPGDAVILANGRVQMPLRYYGWQCSVDDTVVFNEDGAEALAASLRTLPNGPGRTWEVSYRMWEADPKDLIALALDESGPDRVVGEWPGTKLTLHEGRDDTPAVTDTVLRGCVPCEPAQACER